MAGRCWLMLLLILGFLLFWDLQTTHVSGGQLPLIIAHRGASGNYPEATIVALEMAIAQGADLLELDVRLSADGQVVVFHDQVLERVTDGRGLVREHSLAQLQALDAGYNFKAPHDEDYLWRGRQLQIPTLAQVLEAFPAASYIIDVKERDEASVQAVISVLRAHADPDQILVFSLYDQAIALFRELAPEYATAASPREVRTFFLASKVFLTGRLTPSYQVLILPLEAGGLEVANAGLIRAAGALGLEVYVYTVNDPGQIRALLARGAAGIITDYPGVAWGVRRDNLR